MAQPRRLPAAELMRVTQPAFYVPDTYQQPRQPLGDDATDGINLMLHEAAESTVGDVEGIGGRGEKSYRNGDR